MHRRPGLCVLNAFFAAALREPRHRVFALLAKVRNELLCVAWLGPVLRADLRVPYCSSVFALDASPFASGICSAELGPSAVAELWRHCEQRGFYTRLEGPATALLRELGLEQNKDGYGVFGSPSASPALPLPRALTEGSSGIPLRFLPLMLHGPRLTAPLGSACFLGLPPLRVAALSLRASC